MIKILPTKYNGIEYRSRLEARWALFFNLIGLKVEYEAEGFDLGNSVWYLPVFYIPDYGYLEVKFKPTQQEIEKCRKLSELPCEVMLLEGTPNHLPYRIFKDGEEVCPGFFCKYTVKKWGSIPYYGECEADEEERKLLDFCKSYNF